MERLLALLVLKDTTLFQVPHGVNLALLTKFYLLLQVAIHVFQDSISNMISLIACLASRAPPQKFPPTIIVQVVLQGITQVRKELWSALLVRQDPSQRVLEVLACHVNLACWPTQVILRAPVQQELS